MVEVNELRVMNGDKVGYIDVSEILWLKDKRTDCASNFLFHKKDI